MKFGNAQVHGDLDKSSSFGQITGEELMKMTGSIVGRLILMCTGSFTVGVALEGHSQSGKMGESCWVQVMSAETTNHG